MRLTAPPQPSQKVSISSLSTAFNDILCVDHFYLDDENRLFHCINHATRHLTVKVLKSTNLDDSVTAFKASWLSQFWDPVALQGDKEFSIGEVKLYLDKLDIQIRPVSSGRHSENPIESKYAIIRGKYLGIQNDAQDNFDGERASYMAVTISNTLYGNDTMSAFELAKGLTKPVLNNPEATVVPDNLVQAQEKLKARRKLAMILKCKSTTSFPLAPGDPWKCFENKQIRKRAVVIPKNCSFCSS